MDVVSDPEMDIHLEADDVNLDITLDAEDLEFEVFSKMEKIPMNAKLAASTCQLKYIYDSRTVICTE